MHYGFTDDETEIVRHLAQLLTDWSSSHEAAGGGFDADLWRSLAADGWIEALGGSTGDVSSAARVALAEQLGRVCPPVPWTAVLGFAAPLLRQLHGPIAAELLRDIEGGRLVTAAPRHVGLVVAEPVADSAGTGRVQLSGRLGLVPYGQDAEAIVLPAATGSTNVLVAVETGAAGVDVAEATTVDLRHRYADVTLNGVETVVIADSSSELDNALAAAADQYALMLSAEALGGLARLLDDSVRYVTDRRQFGVPIGSFQAVKHLLAHTATTLENGRALTYLAASVAESGEETARADVAAARLYTGRNYLLGAERLIQAHGGFGFTWEAGLHVWYRNAMANSLVLDRGQLINQLDF